MLSLRYSLFFGVYSNLSWSQRGVLCVCVCPLLQRYKQLAPLFNCDTWPYSFFPAADNKVIFGGSKSNRDSSANLQWLYPPDSALTLSQWLGHCLQLSQAGFLGKIIAMVLQFELPRGLCKSASYRMCPGCRVSAPCRFYMYSKESISLN